MSLTGNAKAHNARCEMFIEMRPHGRAGRKAWCDTRKGRSLQGVSLFKLKRAAIHQPFIKKNKGSSLLVDRIERALRVKHPFFGIRTESDLLELLAQVPLRFSSIKRDGWVFKGWYGNKKVTITTLPLGYTPVGDLAFNIYDLPWQGIYLECKGKLMALSPFHGINKPTKI